MEGGDISNQTFGRVVYIWDGLLATLERPHMYRAMLRLGQYQRAYECWSRTSYEIVMVHTVVHTDLIVDVVTHQEDLVPFIEQHFQRCGARVRDVFYAEELGFIRQVASGGYPDIREVYFPSSGHFDLKYGPLGQPVVAPWT